MRHRLRTVFSLLLAIGVVLSVYGAEIAVAQESDMNNVARPGGTLPNDPQVQLVKVADGLADPVNLAAPQDDDRLFVVERPGRIRIVDGDGQLLEEPFLDITDVVKIDFLEQGLLGLAFHPNYAENGRFFVYYTDWRTNGDSFLVEYSVSDGDPNQADPESANTLLSFDQPYVNHNGGTIHFGPDNYLYIAVGDGGLAGDPYDNAQNVATLWGSILRIDVDAENNAYAIPDDNPFSRGVLYSPEANSLSTAVDYHPNAAPEIWAYGLRNPWEFSFDPETGDLYIADVGQNQFEEVNFEPADSAGGNNYGWDLMEGAHPYLPGEANASNVSVGVLPVAEYSHDDGSCSITGGGVHRGAGESLNGIYFNSDFCTGKIWGLAQTDAGWQYAELLDTALNVTGSGMDTSGNVYFTSCNCTFGRDYDPFADPQGAVWQVMAADMAPEGAETAP